MASTIKGSPTPNVNSLDRASCVTAGEQDANVGRLNWTVETNSLPLSPGNPISVNNRSTALVPSRSSKPQKHRQLRIRESVVPKHVYLKCAHSLISSTTSTLSDRLRFWVGALRVLASAMPTSFMREIDLDRRAMTGTAVDPQIATSTPSRIQKPN